MENNMLDFRIHTFLAVCEQMSITKAASVLNLTQPAVTQHMQALQQQLGTSLFTMVGRRLQLTEEGKKLRRFAQSIQVDIGRFVEEDLVPPKERPIRFGATLTIGEFTLPGILDSIMGIHSEKSLSMVVDNTENLLKMLDSGSIDFAFIEGAFDKSLYGYELFSHERFVPICSKACLARHANPSLEDLCGERLLVREKGSGTRAVFEQILAERGLTVEAFSHIDEIGNLNVIKHLVRQDRGISFLYEAAASDMLLAHEVFELPIEGWHVQREFNFVHPLHSRFTVQSLDFFTECVAIHSSWRRNSTNSS